MREPPRWTRFLLVDPDAIERGLARVAATGLVPSVPNRWQITLGVLRMWHRVLFRSETVGTSASPIRRTWRARVLSLRAIRLPFLLAERAVAPLDFSGLISSRERVLRHLLAAHHEGAQLAYDLEILQAHPGALEELLARARRVAFEDTPKSRWLRDLAVFDGYHEHLVRATERALAGDLGLSEAERADPDVSFAAFLRWCAAQPATFEETRAAHYSLAHGRTRISGEAS